MTKSIEQSAVIAFDNSKARALLALLSTTVELGREVPPVVTMPEMPASYPDIQRGLDRIVGQFADPARSQSRRTDASDIEREFLEVMTNAHNSGFDFSELAKVLGYRQERDRARTLQDAYVRSSSARAEALGEAIRDWLEDLSAVLAIREVVGTDVVSDAAQAPNKTMAAMALQMMVQEKATAGAAAELNALAAGRGLMLLAQVDIAASELERSDLEQVAAFAGFAVYPAPLKGYGQQHTPLRIRVGQSVISVTAQAAVLCEEATTQGQGTTVLPRTALVAGSEAALAAAQATIDADLAGTPHQFHDAANDGNSSLAATFRRTYIA